MTAPSPDLNVWHPRARRCIKTAASMPWSAWAPSASLGVVANGHGGEPAEACGHGSGERRGSRVRPGQGSASRGTARPHRIGTDRPLGAGPRPGSVPPRCHRDSAQRTGRPRVAPGRSVGTGPGNDRLRDPRGSPSDPAHALPGPQHSHREVVPPWRGRHPSTPYGFRTEVNTMENRSQLDTEPEEEVVTLEDATRLTKGNTNSSVENKRSPYGA
ncbi:albusnodin family lasso peptide [Streptomyces fradiae ATCC 10745 = DSM 40063]|nr:albusnodin family lasso peptide [Streptomyces fradiae ATCC 10745 = DSM 40063]